MWPRWKSWSRSHSSISILSWLWYQVCVCVQPHPVISPYLSEPYLFCPSCPLFCEHPYMNHITPSTKCGCFWLWRCCMFWKYDEILKILLWSRYDQLTNLLTGLKNVSPMMLVKYLWVMDYLEQNLSFDMTKWALVKCDAQLTEKKNKQWDWK